MGYNKAAGEQVSASEFNSFLASAGLYGASNTGSDAYAITVDPAPNDYDAGDKYTFKADVGNTGPATLNVNGLGAKTIKKFGSSLDLETGDISAGQMVTVRYDGIYFQVEALARPTPFFQQSIPIPDITNGSDHRFGSNASGSVIYLYLQGNTSQELQRFQRDTLTGAYIRTHGVDVSGVHLPGGSLGSLVVIGDYLYHVFSDGTNIDVSRFLAADLTGATVMTVPSVTGAEVIAWTDGTDLYLVSGGSNTTSRRWTVSGTTFTAASTATVTSDFESFKVTMWDGTNAFLIDHSSGNPGEMTIRKLTVVDGSSKTDTTKYLHPFDDVTTDSLIMPALINIDNTKIYIGRLRVFYNQTTDMAYAMEIIPISKP